MSEDVTRKFKEMSLFDDIDDKHLRAYNRGQVLANIVLDGMQPDGKVSASASSDMLEYFQLIPDTDRVAAETQYKVRLMNDGYQTERT